MTLARMNRTGCISKMIVVAALCGIVASGVAAVARWPALQFELGYAYENGNFHGWTPGFAQDHRQAAHWLGQAAEANHPRAQYMLGILHARGWGVPRDDTQAVAWFTRSARNGYAPACYHFGWMLHKGDGVARDEQSAFRLMQQAAGQGMAAAHLALGRFHERGEGISADPVQALKWYALAVHFARTRPGLFDNSAFTQQAKAADDALAARMRPSDVEQGRKLARQWLSLLALNTSLIAPGFSLLAQRFPESGMVEQNIQDAVHHGGRIQRLLAHQGIRIV